MQPVFIRLIDNIRKHLETSDWTGSYREVQIWPEGVSPDTQRRVQHLQNQLSQASPDEASTLQQELEQLPKPVPGYELCLHRGDRDISVDLWDLCYQICFENYATLQQEYTTPAAIDLNLIDGAGDVDWNHLDAKTKRIVSDIFAT